jgi:hypothetical protein
MHLWVQLLLCLISFDVAVTSSTYMESRTKMCDNSSLVALDEWSFNKAQITCAHKYKADLCTYAFLWPGTVLCEQNRAENMTMEQLMSIESKNYVHEWGCESSNSWVSSIVLVCPDDHLACADSITECKIVFDPFFAMIYMGAIWIALGIAIVCIFGCACIAYASHCFFMVNMDHPSLLERGSLVKRQQYRD